MQSADFLAAIRRDGDAVSAVARSADPRAPVPSCPEWSLGQLVEHLGTVHRWATRVVVERAADRLPFEPDEAPGPDLAKWFAQGVEGLLAALSAVGDDEPVWNWTADRRGRFWPRRQAHETAVHRWDAEGATGTPAALDPALSSDGVDEVLASFLTRIFRKIPGSGETIHLHQTDGEGEWLLTWDGDGLAVGSGHAKADVAVRGAGEDLLLCVWGRRPWTGLDVIGDGAVLERWAAHARI